MLTTDAYVYFNLADPLSAWGVARGEIVTTPVNKKDHRGFVSLRMVNVLKDVNQPRFRIEMFLEHIRAMRFNDKISRLVGAYCFPDRVSADRAAAVWSSAPFMRSNLTEVHIHADTQRDQFDSNWVTYAPKIRDIDFLSTEPSWADQYWMGVSHPDYEPIWEMLTDGRMVILDKEKQEKAFETIERFYPNSLGILEISRAAAWMGSDLGNTQAFLQHQCDRVKIIYLIDMRDARNSDFIGRFMRERPILNPHLIEFHRQNGNFGQLPDFTSREFVIKGARMVADSVGHPYLALDVKTQ